MLTKFRPVLSKALVFLGYSVQYYCIAHCTFEYVGDLVVCEGPSMEPTLRTNDILLTDHLTVRFGEISKGDVIIAKCPNNPKQQICKRVIGTAGDKVNTGYLNFEVVPRGHIWIEGDNKQNSYDSRNYGPVPLGLVRARAVVKVWPFSDIRSL